MTWLFSTAEYMAVAMESIFQAAASTLEGMTHPIQIKMTLSNPPFIARPFVDAVLLKNILPCFLYFTCKNIRFKKIQDIRSKCNRIYKSGKALLPSPEKILPSAFTFYLI